MAEVVAERTTRECGCWGCQVLNKTDKVTPAEADRLKQLFEASSSADAVFPTCALTGAGVSSVKDWAVSRIPEGPSFYPKARASLGLQV